MRLRWVVLLGILAVSGVVVGLLGWAMATKEPVTGRSGVTRVGKPAPEIRLATFDGSRFLLSEQRGSPVILNFWASWCPPCRDEAPALQALWSNRRDDGLLVIGVNSQDLRADADSYLSEFGITYTNVPDTDGVASIDYGVIGLPVTFFISKNGVVERRYVGALNAEAVAPWIDRLIAGLPPTGETDVENAEAFFELE